MTSSTSADARAFVDTNVLVYAHEIAAREKGARAQSLVSSLWESGLGCVSVQVLQELFVTLERKASDREDRGAAATVTAVFTRWTVHEPRARDVVAAIDLHERAGISFWDAMIVRSASALGCDVLYTEDLNAGQRYEGVLVVDPFA